MDEVIEAHRGRPLQAKTVRKDGWTAARRTAFLTELAHSCNVRRAHQAAGLTSSWQLRKRDPEFARQWQDALATGYERLEMALLRRALEVVDGMVLDERDEPVEKMTLAQAISVMEKHRQSVAQGQARGRRPQGRQIATQEETDAALLKRIAMVKRQRMRHAAIVDGGELTPVPPLGAAGEDGA